MAGRLSVAPICTSCVHTDLPLWQVAILTAVACLIAYGLLWGVDRLLSSTRRQRAPTAAARYRTVAVNRQQRYSLEVDDRTGTCYVTFPVSNRMADYEEAYEVDRATFERYRANLDSALDFVTRCRNREMDHLLREQPGADRGTPA